MTKQFWDFEIFKLYIRLLVLKILNFYSIYQKSTDKLKFWKIFLTKKNNYKNYGDIYKYPFLRKYKNYIKKNLSQKLSLCKKTVPYRNFVLHQFLFS